MNTAFQAKDGLSPAFFPADVPIFSGHYHIPHVVDNSKIRYIGSPYQGEACTDAFARAQPMTGGLQQQPSKLPACSGAQQLCKLDPCLSPWMLISPARPAPEQACAALKGR